MQIFIEQLPLEFTDEELRALFEEFGTVLSAKIGLDKKTGQPQGYGIVEMPGKREARASVDGLRGKEIQGKTLRVRIMKPDDPFHTAAKPGRQSFGGQVRGGGSGGAIRRGGQRGS